MIPLISYIWTIIHILVVISAKSIESNAHRGKKGKILCGNIDGSQQSSGEKYKWF